MEENILHRIRLKGPWDVRLRQDGAIDEYRRESMPQDWRQLFGNVAGTADFRRNFHDPTGLESDERVVIYLPSGIGDVSEFKMNGQSFSPTIDSSQRYDVTELLAGFNMIEFALTFDPHAEPDIPGGLWETVFVEIHKSVN